MFSEFASAWPMLKGYIGKISLSATDKEELTKYFTGINQLDNLNINDNIFVFIVSALFKAKDFDNYLSLCNRYVCIYSYGLLGFYYEYISSYADAIKYYKLAVEAHDDIGMLYLGDLYTYCDDDKIVDSEKAIKYYGLALECGNSDAMMRLGGIYMYDDDHENYSEAIKYYKLALENNNYKAAIHLGKIYYFQNNYTKAIKYFNLAIEYDSSSSYAFNFLGEYYYDVEENYTKAINYYIKVLELGNKMSIMRLVEHYECVEKNYAEAIKYCLMRDDHQQKVHELCKKYPKDITSSLFFNIFTYLEFSPSGIIKFLNKYDNYSIQITTTDISNITNYIRNYKNECITVSDSLLIDILSKDIDYLHNKYCPDGDGYTDAKKKFESRV